MRNRNFSNFPVGDIPKRLIYERCNFKRDLPVDIGGGVMRGTRLFPGDDTPRTFINCNLSNCEVPPGSTVTNCNTRIAETVVSDVERVRVDGVEVGHQNIRENRHYGRFNPDTLDYEDFPTPVITGGKRR